MSASIPKILIWLTVTGMLALALIASAGGSMLNMPGRSHSGALPPLTAEESLLRDRLRQDVHLLAKEIRERNTMHYRALARTAQLITARFRELGWQVLEETYQIEGQEMVNIVAEVKGTIRPDQIVLIGAHYDSAPGSPGANDNATGVAAVLELARKFRHAKPVRTLRLVAFVNEEPPFFLTDTMGSLVYARRAKERGDKIVAMLSIETIGYYSDHPKSQQYPNPFSLFYPNTGNFIAFVSDIGSRDLLRRAVSTFRETTQFPSEGVAAPAGISGIGWSDHWSFWKTGYPAIMVTDTALYRYPHYHDHSDTPDKVDFDRMARVVQGIGRVVADLLNR